MPPGRTHCVGTHSKAHAVLKQSGERTRRRQADHKTLQDTQARIGLHHAHQSDDGAAGHEAVHVQRQRKVVLRAPALAKVSDVSGFVACVVGATAVGDRDFPAPAALHGVETGLFLRGNDAVIGIAQHVEMKVFADPGIRETFEHRFKIALDAFGSFIADAQQNRCGSCQGLVILDVHFSRQNRGSGLG